ncbi:hypothetical protein JI664_09000 [Rhodobacter sp. NTK016B]|uniref:hypothetical protein n=1 Tax=Rhodobacter sp. NTK016B TaxID=2759676 RepID=UPI001A8E3B6E|nr:hypothetical protein [Rhodobacter sp. NTK016B]MBN8292098.1 hypothetical protein [Rhodobacter sp. NTK016B]
MLLPIVLALAGGVTGAAGAAFLTTWAYLTLSVVVGYGPAALFTGFGLTVLAAGLLVLARNRFTKKTASDPPVSRPVATATGKADLASEFAFTAAFVLARYLGEGRRD